MDRKYGIFYNKQFNVLMINFDSSKSVELTEEKGDICILKNGDDIVGINIFNIPNELNLKDGMYSENEKIVNFVEEKIKNIIEVKQGIQFKIGKVLACEDIESTHLHKTTVLIDEETPIVCGAKNVKEGQYVVVATVGSYMPNGSKIVAGKLRGFDSHGMICSAKELGIAPKVFNDEGIIELPTSYHDKVGESFWKEYYKNNA